MKKSASIHLIGSLLGLLALCLVVPNAFAKAEALAIDAGTEAVLAEKAMPSESASSQQTPAKAAVPKAPQPPVEVVSEELFVDRVKSHAIFRGKVKAVQGEMTLGCDQLFIDFTKTGQSSLREAVATGNVTFIQGDKTATGEKAVYNPVANTVTLTGDVLLVQGNSALSGEALLYDVQTGDMQLKAAAEKKVEGAFRPSK